MISLIAAASRNRVIGRDNQLPWHLPADLARFRRLTLGKPVIMGRRTYQSIGRPLPGRRNIVVTREPGFQAPGLEVISSLESALHAVQDVPEAMIIGGAALFAQALGRADRLYLTWVEAEVCGDRYFPEFTPEEWRAVEHDTRPADRDNVYDLVFLTLNRRLEVGAS